MNIRVAITEFYCDRPGRFAGLFVAGSKSESPAKAGPSVDGLVRLWGDLRRDIGAAVTIAQRPTSGQKRRFDRASAASGLAQQPDILSVPRHASKVPIVLQKSKVASVRIFGETLKRTAIDDSYNLSRATEVAYEFSVRR